MFCQAASLTPSVLHEAMKESPLWPLSWYSAANAVSAILANYFLGNFPIGGISRTELSTGQLVVKTWPLL